MSENDFWTKFFQSYYYRRDQNNTNDMFSDCSLKDEEGNECKRVLLVKSQSNSVNT